MLGWVLNRARCTAPIQFASVRQMKLRADEEMQRIGELRIVASEAPPIGATAKMSTRERPERISSMDRERFGFRYRRGVGTTDVWNHDGTPADKEVRMISRARVQGSKFSPARAASEISPGQLPPGVAWAHLDAYENARCSARGCTCPRQRT